MAISILELIAVGVMNILFTGLFYELEKKTKFGKWKRVYQQILIGVVFGGISVLGTELGQTVNGATLNFRDAAPLCAGLLFGAPAGIIAGVIGGVERYFAVYWGAGTFTQIACSISTVIAGLAGAAFRKWMFDDKKPNWFYALAIAMVVEVIHMLMIFLTNIDQVTRAFEIVERISLWMILGNMIIVTSACLLVTILGKEKVFASNDQRRLAQSFQRWLLLDVVVAFFLTSSFTYLIQKRLSLANADSTLTLNISDVKSDISDASDSNLLSLTNKVESKLVSDNVYVSGAYTDSQINSYLDTLRQQADYDVSEISIINNQGLIAYSSNSSIIGFNMNQGLGGQATEFYDAFFVYGETSYVQAYRPISLNSSTYMKYAAQSAPNGGFVQVGYNAERFQKDLDSVVNNITINRHVGEEGSIFIANSSYVLKSQPKGHSDTTLLDIGLDLSGTSVAESTRFSAKIYSEDAYVMYVSNEGYLIVAELPVSEVDFSTKLSVYVSVFMEVVVFGMLFAAVYFLIKKLVVENIERINDALGQITGGNLNVSVNVRSNEEFASLSDDINTTVVTLKGYISEAAARIDKELEFAKEIQLSALPAPLDGKDRFSLKAKMRTAKEVGGDFYDYFPIDENRVALVIADVSGKGIPAALFMMKSKTLIKSLAENGQLSPAAILEKANAELALGNDAEMFVTVWLGIYDFSKEILVTANAGHEFPAIAPKGQPFNYLKDKHGFVLAGMSGSRYKETEIPLHPGDTIFVYTDGVTEATNNNKELFGDQRLLAALNQKPGAKPSELLSEVIDAIDVFDGTAPQFDDITMLCFHVYAEEEKIYCPREITLEAKVDNIEPVTAFVDKALEDYGCPLKVQMQIDIALDEIFSNIAHYAYTPRSGNATVKIEKTFAPDGAKIVFYDEGLPFDPLKKADPDVNAPLEKRSIGGLGIYMVKKSMDEVKYAHKEGKNILTIVKKF